MTTTTARLYHLRAGTGLVRVVGAAGGTVLCGMNLMSSAGAVVVQCRQFDRQTAARAVADDEGTVISMNGEN